MNNQDSKFDKELFYKTSMWSAIVFVIVVAVAFGYTIYGFQVGIKKTVNDELSVIRTELTSKLMDANSDDILSSIKILNDDNIKRIEKQIPVGTIFSSILPPDVFKSHYGDKWSIADGRQVDTKSLYFSLTKRNFLPDLRGQFLRGLNLDRSDGKEDPGGPRKAGDFQEEMLKSHDHGRKMARWQDSGVGGHVRNNGGRDQHGDHWNPRYVSGQKSGGVETRPKNVAVYFYIKIN